jgi:hypothetical protein
LTPQDYYKKTKVKKPIEPLDLRQKKKDDLMGCVTIILYKKCENALQTLVVFFFFRVITLCNKYVKIKFYP